MSTRTTAPPRFEFLGLPGAGKSSILSETVELLEQLGLTVEQRRPKTSLEASRIGRWLEAALGGIELFRALTLPGRAAVYGTTKDRLQQLYALSLHRRSLTRASIPTADLVMLDHGALQCLSAGLGQSPLLSARTLLGRFPTGWIQGAIVVDVPVDVAIRRARSRTSGGAWFDGLSTRRLQILYSEWMAGVNVTREAAQDSGIPVLAVDGINTLHTNAGVVAKWILERARLYEE